MFIVNKFSRSEFPFGSFGSGIGEYWRDVLIEEKTCNSRCFIASVSDEKLRRKELKLRKEHRKWLAVMDIPNFNSISQGPAVLVAGYLDRISEDFYPFAF